MPYRNDDIVNLAQKAREAAQSKNDVELQAKKLKAAKFIPNLVKMALEEVKYASKYGEFWVDFRPPFWDIRYWFCWDSVLRDLLRTELTQKNFDVMELLYTRPVLRIYWGSNSAIPVPRVGTEIALPG